MIKAFLADTVCDNIQELCALLEKEHGMVPDIWQNSRRYHTFLENPQNKIVFIRIDDPSIPGLMLTQSAAAHNANTHIVWMAKSGAYAVDAFRYGAEAYMLLPAAKESLRDIMDSLVHK